ncbi:MAG TPA: hypothetical protein VIK84_00610 [Haloplasmataceae bacterium]
MVREWMKLDNAAKIYPLVESDFLTTVFRFSITLNIDIDKDILLKALNNIIKRFPYYKVTLKKGIFWYYLEENKQDLLVFKDEDLPCRRMLKEDNNGYLFRVLYIDKKISIEFNHILGDGTACLIFLCTLTHEYLRLVGINVSINEWIKDINEEVDEKEFEDSHSIIGKKHLHTHNKKLKVIKNVFHIKGRILNRKKYLITYGIMDAQNLYETAKKFKASITVFLTSLYLETLLEIQKETVKKRKRKPVAIQVPINMRKRLDSVSMRNFSLFIRPYLYPDEDYSFEKIIEIVKDYFTEYTTNDNLLALMVQNYRTEKTPFVRLLPLVLKSLITPLIYKAVGADTYSGTISNIGMVKLPNDMEEYVQRIDFVLGPCPITKTLCAVSGYKDQVFISFGRSIKDALVERKFFRKLVELGVKVHVEN